MERDTIKFGIMEVPSIINSLAPLDARIWQEDSVSELLQKESITIRAWRHYAGFFCLSAVEFVLPEGALESRPEYHLGFSRVTPMGVIRVTSNEANWLLKEFGADGFFEDNHVPNGKVRNFWRPVNENLVGQVCACVDDEPAIREDKGDYVWRHAPEK